MAKTTTKAKTPQVLYQFDCICCRRGNLCQSTMPQTCHVINWKLQGILNKAFQCAECVEKLGPADVVEIHNWSDAMPLPQNAPTVVGQVVQFPGAGA